MITLVVVLALLVLPAAGYIAGRADGYWSGWLDGRDDLADQQTPNPPPRDECGRWRSDA